MKTLRRIVMAAAMALSVTTAAGADNVFWFEAVGNDPLSGVAVQGSETNALDLTCTAGPGGQKDCSWDVSLLVNIAFFDAFRGWSLDLVSEDAPDKVTADNVEHNPFPNAFLNLNAIIGTVPPRSPDWRERLRPSPARLGPLWVRTNRIEYRRKRAGHKLGRNTDLALSLARTGSLPFLILPW